MKEVGTIGIDIAKSVFQVHGINAVGDVVICRKLRRSEVEELFKRLPACLIGIEACASGHHWARTLINMGHDGIVKLKDPGQKFRSTLSLVLPAGMRSHSTFAWLRLSVRDHGWTEYRDVEC